MSNIARMMQRATAGAGGEALNVEDVFSTYLWDGNGSSQTIVNGIDLAGEGGLVWEKVRNQGYPGGLYDTERGALKQLRPDNTDGTNTRSGSITSFNSNGFSIGNDAYQTNGSGNSYASWTFRKAPKFFTMVTWSGTGNENNTINHDLGSVPGMIIVKRTDSSSDWLVYHRGVNGGTNPEQYNLKLNETERQDQNSSYFSNTAPTETTFKVGSLNSASGGTYVAYLFAHNNNDGEFGGEADADIIKCGSFTSNASGAGLVGPDLGFEPQWVLLKNATSTASGNWWLFDSMRGFTATGGGTAYLQADTIGAEGTFGGATLNLTNNGFTMPSNAFAGGQTFIYMAIRRGTKVPESGTEVFDVEYGPSSGAFSLTTGFPVDMAITTDTTGGGNNLRTRLLGGNNALQTESSNAEGSSTSTYWDSNTSFDLNLNSDYSGWINWMWKRAPGYFDAVAEPIASAQMSGPASSSYNPAHNLGVTPEMIWVKDRDNTDNWYVYHSALGTSKKLILNSDAAESSSSWAVASDNFNFYSFGNATGNAICYLFASLDGISKVGSYTGDGTTDGSKVIDCGFSSGARFVLLKKTTGNGGEWYVFDTVRGIVSGNEGRIEINTTSLELASDDFIDPASSGFAVNGHVNQSGETYIFYAIA